MALYLLHRLNRVDWDENEGFVIRAPNSQKAREMANAEFAAEGAIWEDHDLVACDKISVSGMNCVILKSFNAG